jgi:hypothetical protein
LRPRRGDRDKVSRAPEARFGGWRLANARSCYTATMSEKQLRALRALAANVRKYTPRIEEKLCKAGIKPDPALVYTAAKYYDALDRLAKA